MPCILICDDDAMFRVALGQALAGKGLEVLSASCAEEAVAQLEHPSLIYAVIDLDLPSTNGFALLCELLGRAPELRVLVLTANYSAVVHHAATLLGAFGCMSKPTNAREIMSCLTAESPMRCATRRLVASAAE